MVYRQDCETGKRKWEWNNDIKVRTFLESGSHVDTGWIVIRHCYDFEGWGVFHCSLNDFIMYIPLVSQNNRPITCDLFLISNVRIEQTEILILWNILMLFCIRKISYRSFLLFQYDFWKNAPFANFMARMRNRMLYLP